ncbi:MAG: alanine racemase [Deltaproteobacteria bacterium]|nr:alanine racemase [Deltaproteobacteria bacterium]
MYLTLGRVIEITGAVPRGDYDPMVEVHGISTDTRTMSRGDLFVCLKGAFFDGADFLEDALASGACGGIVQVGSAPHVRGPAVFEVPNPLASVQALAAAGRASMKKLEVVGITGSNGKTAAKDMLTSILANAGLTVLSTSGTRNSQLGTALTLLDLRPEHEVAVIEAGISRPGEMLRLASMIRPTMGIITLIGDAHAEFLGGGESTAKEKAVLFKNIRGDGIVLLNGEDKHSGYIESLLECRTIKFGFSKSNDVRAEHIRSHRESSSFVLCYGGRKKEVELRAVGEQAVHNALSAAGLAIAGLGIGLDEVAAGLRAYVPAPMRLELIETDEDVTVLNDAYVADPLSSRRALLTLAKVAGNRRKVAVLGDMLELGKLSEKAHRSLAASVMEAGVHELVTVGRMSKWTAEEAVKLGLPSESVTMCMDASEASRLLESRVLNPGDVLLIKGSRALKLERVARDYLKSLRPTRLVIDLNAVAANARVVRKVVGNETTVCGVIKSHGYGLDSRRIAGVLLDNGVDWLAVAIPDEGVRLRKEGIKAPILVLGGPLPEEADKIAAFDLTPIVSKRSMVKALAEEAMARNKEIDIHLKVDTGMGRLGLKPDEVLSFAREVSRLDRVKIQGLMTHFPSADDPGADDFTRAQVQTLLDVAKKLEAAGFRIRYKHAANSIGLIRFPEARLDMVRPGLALYGMWSSHDVPRGAPQLHPVASLVTKISYLKKVSKGTPISYGMTYKTPRESIIATLPLGYVDGLFRSLSNKGVVLVKGERAPIVGMICMDQTMVDVTHVPGVEVGDEVVLFGRQGNAYLDIREIASLAGTIPYEVLARIDARVPRVHSSRA